MTTVWVSRLNPASHLALCSIHALLHAKALDHAEFREVEFNPNINEIAHAQARGRKVSA